MLHARHNGETFGLAVAEFSVRNKPVLTQRPNRHYADFHIRTLGPKAFLFGSKEDVVAILSTFIADGIPKDVDYNCYRDYLPDKVMGVFKSLFLDVAIPLIGKNVSTLPTLW